MKTLTLLPILCLAVFFTACDETKKVIDTAGNVQLSGTYTVTSLNEVTTNATNINISFAALDQSVRGNTGCNNFFGNYTLDLYALTFKDFAVTEMACDEPIHSREQAFLDATRNTGSYTYDKGVLTLFSKLDRSELLTATKDKNETN